MSFLRGCPSTQSSWIGGIKIVGRKLSNPWSIEDKEDRHEGLLTAVLWTYCLWSGTTCIKGSTKQYVRYAVKRM
jgi:hypothetical protein